MDAMISSSSVAWASSFTFSIGTIGAAGSAGTGTGASVGGTGALGVIVIDEFYE